MPEQYASVGHVVQIIGPVVDIQFDADKLPPIYNAIHITSDGYNIPQPLDVIAEVQRLRDVISVARNVNRVIDRRQFVRVELDIDDGTDDLDHVANAGVLLWHPALLKVLRDSWFVTRDSWQTWISMIVPKH